MTTPRRGVRRARRRARRTRAAVSAAARPPGRDHGAGDPLGPTGTASSVKSVVRDRNRGIHGDPETPSARGLALRPADRADAREARRRASATASSCTSPSGMASARSSFAAARTCSSRAAICGRSIAISPSCTTALLSRLPAGCVIDGEIVIATPRGLDFDALQLRLHPAASRVAKLAKETPASFVAFDLLAVDGRDLRGAPQRERRVLLERALADAEPPRPPDADDARSAPSRRSGSRASKAPASTA